jgi:cobalt-zinc-cadmium efflux system membrane fusion protein
MKRMAITGLLVVLLLLGAAGMWWLTGRPRGAAKAAAPPLPATIKKILKEDEINTVTLTAAAIERLAMKTATIERKAVKQTRVYGGEVIVPVGRSILVSAPLGGTLSAPEKGFPRAGESVVKGREIFRLSPILTPEGRVNLATAKVEADGQVENAKTQLEASRIALERAKRLVKSDAGSRRAVDEAQAQYDLATKTVEAAKARRALLEKVIGNLDKGISAPLVIESPESGLLRTVSALPGQNVPSGAALFEVVNLERVWVRVPVYVGDLRGIDNAADARIGGLTARPGARGLPASPALAPPAANPAAGTVDLVYEMDNRESKYEPGRRVGAVLSLKGESTSLTVPWSAVIFDIYGGTWVYEQTGERTFVRQRVAVRYVTGTTAVLSDGPPVGTRVVTAGAAELFGAETGFSK